MGAHINMSPTEGFGFKSVVGSWRYVHQLITCATNGREKIWGAF